MKKLSEKLQEQLSQVQWSPDPSILLCPNIPQPMYGIAPRVILGMPWWNKTRQAAYRSTNYHCLACGVQQYEAKYHQWLEGHEMYDIDYLKGIMTYTRTVPLCHFCHNFIHDGRMKWQLNDGLMHQAKYVAIMQHGDAILAKAGLVRGDSKKLIDKLIANGGCPPQMQWSMVINGVVYPRSDFSQEMKAAE